MPHHFLALNPGVFGRILGDFFGLTVVFTKFCQLIAGEFAPLTRPQPIDIQAREFYARESHDRQILCFREAVDLAITPFLEGELHPRLTFLNAVYLHLRWTGGATVNHDALPERFEFCGAERSAKFGDVHLRRRLPRVHERVRELAVVRE